MRKVWVVAAREYRTNLRSKTFIIAMVMMPVFMFGSIIVQRFTEGRVDTDAKRVAVVDRSGKMFEALSQAAARRNDKEIKDPDTGRQKQPRYDLIAEPVAKDEQDRQLLDLSERVRDGKLFAFIEIAPTILAGRDAPDAPDLRYYSNQPTYVDLRRWLSRIISGQVQKVRLDEAGIDTEVVDRAMQPVALENLGLLTLDESGHIREAKEVNTALSFMVPLAIMMLMWMALMITTQPMLQGVLEEKMQRIAEVLLGSIPPFELMLGKLLGYVAVALTLIGIYLAGGYFVADRFGYADAIPIHLIGWFVLFLSLAIFMYGALFLAVGSACNEVREAQSLAMPLWIPLIVPMMCWMVIVQHPNSGFSLFLSLFPLFAPMTMMMRMAVPPGVPLWQVLIAASGTILMTLACVWAGGRVFRIGLLLQGKPPKMRQILRWVVRS